MIGEAWDRFMSYTLSMVFGGGMLILLFAVGVAVGFWLAWRRREFLIDQAVKRDRVARAWADAAAETVDSGGLVPAQRGES